MGNIQNIMRERVFYYSTLSLTLLAAVCINYLNIIRVDSKILQLKNTIEYTPTSCIIELNKRLLLQLHDKTKKVIEHPYSLLQNECIFKRMLIRGVSSCEQPLQSKLDDTERDFIYTMNYCKVRHSNDDLKKLFS